MHSTKQMFKRKKISLEIKMLILDRLRNGEKVVALSKDLDMNEATIRTIKRNEEVIRDNAAVTSTQVIYISKNLIMTKFCLHKPICNRQFPKLQELKQS